MQRIHDRRGVLAGLSGASLCATSAGAEERQGLEVYRWRKRLVVALAPTAEDPRLIRQHDTVSFLTRRDDDRDLVWVEVAGAAVRPPGLGEASSLRRCWRVDADAFTALLIGKDGGVKLRATQPISAAELAATIDAMPMRRSEMGRGGG